MTPERLQFLRSHAERHRHLTPAMALELVREVDHLREALWDAVTYDLTAATRAEMVAALHLTPHKPKKSGAA